jgi:bifunctional non-homologous end joining protein LigD
MLATLGPAPGSPNGFAVEFKHDGQRALTTATDAGVAVFSRNGAIITRTFPEVTAAVDAAIPARRRRAVLDGEIVALDATGRPCFERLQRRWPQNRRPSAALLAAVPVRYFVFDVLAVDGAEVVDLPYWRRRELLQDILGEPADSAIVVPPVFTDIPASEVLEVARQYAYEGVVAKRLESPYRAGRSRLWTKSPVRLSLEAAIVGFIGGPRRGVAAVLVAAHDEHGQLRLIGRVGSGLSGPERQALFELLSRQRVAAPPVPAEDGHSRYVRWVEPTLVAEVAYREYSSGQLRHPAWKGLRRELSGQVPFPDRPPR